MIRSTYRNIMVAMLLVCFGVAYYMFTTSQAYQVQIQQRTNEIIRLNQELENAQNLNVALTELDNLTITEQTATQLDILRHLGLENSELTFQLEARDVQAIGPSSLYVHTVAISGNMPYAEALALCDRLQNTKKIVITTIELRAPPSGTTEDKVDLRVIGLIYGLEKVIPPLDMLPLPASGQPLPSEGDPS